jgi:hypothetical protein
LQREIVPAALSDACMTLLSVIDDHQMCCLGTAQLSCDARIAKCQGCCGKRVGQACIVQNASSSPQAMLSMGWQGMQKTVDEYFICQTPSRR